MKKILLVLMTTFSAFATDHNEPDSVNAIFSNVEPSSADVYGLFGYPVERPDGGQNLVVILTYSPEPGTGSFEPKVMHELSIATEKRGAVAPTIEDLIKSIKQPHPATIRVSYRNSNGKSKAFLQFKGFQFTDSVESIEVGPSQKLIYPYGYSRPIKVSVGGFDDPFFTDLNGFFNSIHYKPYLLQPYKRPKKTPKKGHEFSWLKSLLVLNPEGSSESPFKEPLESVYAARDDRGFYNVNAIVLEIPYHYITSDQSSERLVRLWGAGYQRKGATALIESRPDFNTSHYDLADTLGVPFVDTVIGRRADSFNKGYDNKSLAKTQSLVFNELVRQFGRSIQAMGYTPCVEPEDVAKLPELLLQLSGVATHCFLQRVDMGGINWKTSRTDKAGVEPPRTIQLFLPNALRVDMDTNGTWPFGRRLEDQVASRFTALFLEMGGQCGNHRCNLDSFQHSDMDRFGGPINPAQNDRKFAAKFPYLGKAWTADEIPNNYTGPKQTKEYK